MARFSGLIGYAVQVEKAPGVWDDRITEHPYRGDVLRSQRSLQNDTENLHQRLNVNNSISIIGDPFAYENFFAIKYIKWMGSRWNVTNVEVRRPRLILTIGGLYNGPTP